MSKRQFFYWAQLCRVRAILAPELLLAGPTVRAWIYIAALLTWMAFLQIGLHAAPLSEKRWAAIDELKDLHLGRVLGRPPISVNPIYIGGEETLGDLRKDKAYPQIQNMIALFKEAKPQEAYVLADKFLEKQPNSYFAEWLHYFKADMMFAVQEAREKPQYSLAIEDYELALRRYPLSEHVERAIYQTALAQFRAGLNQESSASVRRALSEFQNGKYGPQLILVNGEQYLQSKNYDAALNEYSQIIRRFPKTQAAVDAAFRRAYLEFDRGNYKAALSTYQDLDKYHSQVLQLLRMETEASAINKYVDRVLYAETLFLNGEYLEASKIFQNLGNLFPKDPRAPLLWIRFGDTYLRRGMSRPALAMYQSVEKNYRSNTEANAWAKIKLADYYTLTESIEAQAENRRLLEKAFELTVDSSPDYAAVALSKLAQFLITTKSYPKAQAVLEQYRSLFPKGEQIAWVTRRQTELLELEILDHYKAGDYLAALTRYLSNEKDSAADFKNVDVLLKLSEAARELELIEKSSEILNRIIYLESSADARQIALLRLVENLNAQGEYRKSSERLRRFNFAYPRTNYQYLYDKLWGDLYRGLKNPSRALEHYEKALKGIDGKQSRKIEMRQILLYLGELYEAEGAPHKAIEAYEVYLDIFSKPETLALRGVPFTPKDKFQVKVSQYRIADLYYNMRDFVKALSAYQRVIKEIKEEPFASHAKYRIGECYLALDDREAALEAFKEVKSDDPQNIWVRAAEAYIAGVQMEVKYGIRVFN